MPTINDRLSNAGILLGRYESPGGFIVWRDDSPDGIALIGISWKESTGDGMKRESWDAYGSIHWPPARMATGHGSVSARLQALDMPVVASPRAFLPELAI